MKVLIAEDDRLTRHGLVEIFSREGFDPIPARDGEEALRLFEKHKPDVACLDIMMPGLDGYEVCRRLRRAGSKIPILFISAKSEEIDTVVGLELGADDFITKPFGMRAVIARVRAVRRRALAQVPEPSLPPSFIMAGVRIVPAELRAYRPPVQGQTDSTASEVIDLSPRDVKILSLLYRERGRAVTRDRLFQEVWGHTSPLASRALDQHISQLRKRLEPDQTNPTLIRTVHGVGYRYEG
ncbi:MAG: response regulator transcription factor [Verrucomicrobiales bacterium]